MFVVCSLLSVGDTGLVQVVEDDLMIHSPRGGHIFLNEMVRRKEDPRSAHTH